MRLITVSGLIVLALASPALAAPALAQDSGNQTSAESVQAVGAGVRLTAAVVALPLRLVGNVAGAVLKQTFTGLSEGSKEDPFGGTSLAVDDDVLSRNAARQSKPAQPAPVVPREVTP